MRKLDEDRQDWTEATIGELAAFARIKQANPLTDSINQHILESHKAALDVPSFWMSMLFWVRTLGRRNTPVVRDPKELVDILCGEKLPNREQLSAFVRLLNVDDVQAQRLHELLAEQQREHTSPPEQSGLATTLEEQGHIVGLGAARREIFRRMAGASAELTVA